MSLRDMVVASQLLPPDLRRGVLHRKRLAARLGMVLETPLTLVQAGTGYGKSTALAGLAAQWGDLFWYTVREPERDPLLFVAHLLAAFDQGSRPWGKPFLQHLERLSEASGGQAILSSLNFLINTLTDGLAGDVVLVVDDVHLVLDVPEVAALVERLVELRPPHLHIVLSGRQFPYWAALTRWRVKGMALSIDQNELAFNVEEIASLFRQEAGCNLSPTQAAALAQETEGWAIALQMIAQRLRQGSTRLEEVLEQLPGALEELFDYLAEEVLARQPLAVQRFLLDTAVLRQMSGPSCDALWAEEAPTQTQPAGASSDVMLRRLHDSGLFLTSVEAETYRYQNLFHDFLLARLRQDSTRFRMLHLKAAAFLAASGNREESVYHLIEAGSFSEAAALIQELGPALLQVGRSGSLTGWIDRLPAEVSATHAGLRLLRGDVLRLRARFDEAIEECEIAEQLYSSAGNLEGRSRALRSQAQVYLDTVRPLQANRLLEEALRLLEPQEHPAEVAALLEQLAENQLNLGQPLQAQALHQEARLLRAESDPSDFYLEARALLRTGRLAAAQQLLEAHQEPPEAAFLRPQRFHRETPLLLSLVCIMQGKVELAEIYARQGQEIGERLESPFVVAVALMRLGHALQLYPDFPWNDHHRRQAEQAYLKAIELVRPFKVTRVQVEPLWGLCRLTGYHGNLADAHRHALLAIEIAEQAGDLWLVNLVRTVSGAALVQAGQSSEARPWLEAARAGFEQVGDLFGWSAASLWLALNAWYSGNPDEAVEILGTLLPVVRQQGYNFLLTRSSHLGLPDNQAALPLLVEAHHRGIEASFLGELLGSIGLTGAEYHPGYPLFARTLGPFEVWRGNIPVVPRNWQREKARQLFQFLLCQRGQWLGREQIVDRLWPHLDAEAGAQNFKVALNALHRALEPDRPAGAAPFFVVRRENAYALNPHACIWVDADVFEQGATSLNVENLEQALMIYEDDYLTDCLGEDWAENERERLRQLYLAAAGRLGELHLSTGALDAALSVAGKMIERDQCWEPAYRLMMRAYARQSSRAQVKAVYNRCAAVLREELDVEPSAETKELLDNLDGTS